MRADQAPALAYLCVGLCSDEVEQNARRLDRLSSRLGYTLCETVATDLPDASAGAFLRARIRAWAAEAVFVPSAAHLGGWLDAIVRQADVVESTGTTYARWPTLSELFRGDDEH
ncbi:hypothetical protein [Nocardia farcinica]|uniref:hypothetical protein n=1 Tax=Nocardia farcinica TaxID=37329 RepID=UPI0012FEF4DB|nr:hypothetical protein [Nocardia farcinica]